MAQQIINYLEEVKRKIDEEVDSLLNIKEKEETFLPKNLTLNAYENTKRFTIREISPKLNGFLPDTREKKGMLDHFKNGWIGKKAGDSITFTLEASNIAVQYRKTIERPALRAKLVLDEQEDKAVILDGNFEEDWGDCLWLEPVLHHGEKKMHTIEIAILEDEKNNKENKKEKTPFYLLSVIGNFSN